MGFEQGYNGTIQASALTTLTSQLDQLISTSNLYKQYVSAFNISCASSANLIRWNRASLALVVVLAITPFLTALINMGSIGIARVLRRQISYNLHQFTKPSYLPSTIDLENMDEAVVIPGSANEVSPSQPSLRGLSLEQKGSSSGGSGGREKNMGSLKASRFKSGTVTEAGLPSRATIRKEAFSGGGDREQATRIMVLQRAERDLVVVRFFFRSRSSAFKVSFGMTRMNRLDPRYLD